MADAADVVAREIDEHEVLGAFLLVGEQVLLEGEVVGVGGAAFARAGDGTDLDEAVGEAHVDLGRGADDGEVARVQNEHVRRRVDGAQGAVEIERRAVEGLGEALRRHELDDVARAHELLAGLDGVLEGGLGEVAPGRGDEAGVDERGGRERAGLGEQGVEGLELDDGAGVGGLGCLAGGEVGVDAEAEGLFRAIKDQQRVGQHEVEQGRAELVGGGGGDGGLDARGVFVGDEADRAAGEAR